MIQIDDDVKKFHNADDGLHEVARWLWIMHRKPLYLTASKITVARKLGVTLEEYAREKQRMGL